MTLFRKIEPFADESLPGLIARAAATNVYPRALDVLVQAGDRGLRPESIAMRDPAIAGALAEVLGTEAARILPMFHRPAGDKGMIDFFGVPIRGLHRETKLRRVSPSTLSDGVPYVRALWHLRPLSFDLSTKELLIDRCPECSKTLAFTRTKGIAICEHCEADLRRHPQERVMVEDMEALDFIASLVDPAAAVLSTTIPAGLAALGRGQLFELGTAIATALMINVDPGRPITMFNGSRAGIQQMTPESLASAGRALLSWPSGFLSLCEAAFDGRGSRDTKYGVIKELGAIGHLPNDEMLDAPSREVIAQRIALYLRQTSARAGSPRRVEQRLNNAFAGANELWKAHGVDYRAVCALAREPGMLSVRASDARSAPILLDRWQANGILSRYKDLRSEGSVSMQLGIPADGLRDLASRGLLERGRGLETTLVAAEVNYSDAVIEAVFSCIRDMLPVAGKVPGFVPFGEALLMFPAGRRPWAPLIEDILLGYVPAVLQRTPASKNLLASVMVQASCIDRIDVIARQARFPARTIGRIPIGAANLMLGIRKYDVFQALIEASLLTMDAQKALAYDAVLDFAHEFILTNEISTRSRRDGRLVRGWLATHGISMVLEIPKYGGVYKRTAIESLLEPGLDAIKQA